MTTKTPSITNRGLLASRSRASRARSLCAISGCEPSTEIRLLLFSHPRSKGTPAQPSIAPPFEPRSGPLDVRYIELEPGLGHRQMIRPCALAKTGLGRMRERPE